MISEKLTKLGFDEWFLSERDAVETENFEPARVITVNKNNYLISSGDEDILSELSGKFIFNIEVKSDYPAAGDWVLAQFLPGENFSIIHELLPRKSVLQRKAPGRNIDYQVIASNIDYAIIMQSVNRDFNLRRLERYLVIVNESKIKPVVLLSKSDLASPEEIEEKKKKLKQINPELEIRIFSNLSDPDINEIKNILIPGKTYCLIGSSGVGKSTLLNKLLQKELFKTQEIREKDDRGKHTTSRRELTMLDNGAIIIDTPGMRELGVMGVDEGIEDTFSEITELAENCKYKDCTHTVEEGCAILQALEEGKILPERYQNYKKIYKESLYYQMSYVEKRQKDKKFGKFIHNYLKNNKKDI